MLYFKEGKENISVEKYPTDTTAIYKIQPGDILNVEISSTVATQKDIVKEKFEEEKGGPSTNAGKGYMVGRDGNIELPLIGIIHVGGLSVSEANETIKKKLSEYQDFTFVKTSIVNFKVTVLGEVKSPGTKAIQEENITLFQVLGLAGDISEVGNRKNVRIIRKVNNETQVITVDVSKTDLVSSNYYYLFPNDVVYVEPLRVKSFRFNMTLITIATSLTALVLTIINFTRK